MSRLDWVIQCNDIHTGTCTILCVIFQHAYDEREHNDPFRVWLSEIKPKIGVHRPRLRVIREAFYHRVWEDLC